jgi:benzoyl-CoA 2,3-epoxidase subunit A
LGRAAATEKPDNPMQSHQKPQTSHMNVPAEAKLIKQHLIDPEICIRCNTCESVCPMGAITHDAHNYVVDADICNWCNACIEPCPTGSIDNYRKVVRAQAYSLEAQLGWDQLPPEKSAAELLGKEGVGVAAGAMGAPMAAPKPQTSPPLQALAFNAAVPPWSAAHPYTQLYGPKAAQKSVTATVVSNERLTCSTSGADSHQIVLDLGSQPFPVLEGQRIGVLPPGLDADGRHHHARQYSVSSARDGALPGRNTLAITVKRLLEGHGGQPVLGVASNHLCDLQPGGRVEVVGPFGVSFLMPNHAKSNLLMVCTGTGIAPMRAMIERRQRLREAPPGSPEAAMAQGKLLLFAGARTPDDLPYGGALLSLSSDFIGVHTAFSRQPGAPKRHVQDAMRERSADLVPLLQDRNTFVYVCGVKGMEEGVVMALRDAAMRAGMGWNALSASLKEQGRLHIETY